MRSLFLLAPAILIASMSTIATSAAQTQPQSGGSYEQQKAACRQEGEGRRNLMGNDLTRFVEECVAQGSGTSTAAPTGSSYEAKAQACRREGEFQQNLSGSALQAFVAKCVGQ